MRALGIVSLLAVLACANSTGVLDGYPGSSDDPGNTGGGDPDFIPEADAGVVEPCARMDIVFVVDDSNSMQEEQDNLARNFPTFIDLLDDYETSDGQQLDYRVAVTTTGRDLSYTVKLPPPWPPLPMVEPGANGAFLQRCDMTRPWLERDDPAIKDQFSCVARVGTSGPSLEMPLHVLELAFSERIDDGSNAGFLRDDALLAVVVLSDEDDCSRTDNDFEIEGDSCKPAPPEAVHIQHYVDYFDTLKQNRGRWASAIIGGPGPDECESSFGKAVEATRLLDFTAKTGDNAVFSSICAGDLSQPLVDALENFELACEKFPEID